jgi:predicted DNA-binding transcriptional regulator YafY
MRRADRLIKLTHFLRSRRRAVTARQIAEAFEICTRTVYRDIQDLMAAGVPVAGEAGVGYVIDKQYYLPPVSFDTEELEAIALGISVVRHWTDVRFAAKADSAFERIKAILPARLQGELDQITTYSGQGETGVPWTVSFSDLRDCIRDRHKVSLCYRDGSRAETARVVRPLSLIFFGPVWLLAGWCEMRGDFRTFRLDRIGLVERLDERFEEEPGKDLAAYRAKEARC